jgi:RNA polymerase-binding transcription factor DksA
MNARLMRYLTIEQRETLERELKALIEARRGEIKDGLRVPNRSEETDDDAVVDLETSLDIAELERTTLELRDAVKALARLHEPDYGLCAECGAEIPYARQQASPTATRCVPCQRERERGAPQVARL